MSDYAHRADDEHARKLERAAKIEEAWDRFDALWDEHYATATIDEKRKVTT